MKVISVKQEAWQDRLGYYSTDYGRVNGPSVNVKLHGIWKKLRDVEAALDIEIPDDIDYEGLIQWDVVEHELEWFKDWIGAPGDSEPGLLDFAGPLDASRFELAGRQSGHLVYNLHSRYEDRDLSPDEVEALAKLWEIMPRLVSGVEWALVREYAIITVEKDIEARAASSRAKHTKKLKVAATLGDLDEVERRLAKVRAAMQRDANATETATEIVDGVLGELYEKESDE